MSPYLEFEGKNIEKAIKKACDKLKISKEDLKYTVVSHGSTGMFGVVGSKKAKISVTIPEKDEDLTSKVKHQSDSNKKGQRISNQTEAPNDDVLTDELIEIGEDILRHIVDIITADASISTEKLSNRILYKISGGNSAVLIGKHGQTLEAIQYIVEKCVNKQSRERVRVQIDVNGYLEKRKASLEGLAARLAEKSKNNGKPITVGKMNAYERRIVHMALKDDGEVRTQSMGNGSIRKLMIFPKKNNRRSSHR